MEWPRIFPFVAMPSDPLCFKDETLFTVSPCITLILENCQINSFCITIKQYQISPLYVVVSYAWLATTQYWWMLQLFCFSWWLALLYCKSIWKTTTHEMAIWRVCTSTYMLVLKKGFFLLILSYVYCMVVFMLILHK